MTTTAGRPEHGYDIDTERCTCGGLIVYFEDGDQNRDVGLGCDVAGRTFPTVVVVIPEEDQDGDVA
jgi:hypothetical protein